MTQQCRKVWQCIIVEHNLRLLIGSGHNVADRTQRCRLHLHLDVRQKWNQMWHNAAVDDELNLLIATIGQIAERPHGVNENVHIGVVYEMTECWKDLIDGLQGRWWVLVTAKIDNHPGDVAQEADGNVGLHERQQRRHDAHLNDIISQMRSIADDVAECPDRLLADIWRWR